MNWVAELDRWAADYLPDMRIAEEEPMARHTSFRIGGPARRMAFPESGEQMVLLLSFARACGARPLVIGKPEPAMVRLALERTGFAPDQAVMVGDRLYTDIAAGVNAGIDTVFVLSGEGTEADLASSEVRPTWIFQDIAALHRAWEKEHTT